jgi:hypothetical protein
MKTYKIDLSADRFDWWVNFEKVTMALCDADPERWVICSHPYNYQHDAHKICDLLMDLVADGADLTASDVTKVVRDAVCNGMNAAKDGSRPSVKWADSVLARLL